jgi:Glycerophosphoryl diester phosphodiesterase family
MRAVMRWYLGWFALAAGAVLCNAAPGTDGEAGRAVRPLIHAHAHNDYAHKRPLFDALDQGFCSVEADVFLVKGALLVGHDALELRKDRTLEKLYLDPLRARIKANGGRVYKHGPPIWLLIDVKSEARSTYEAIDQVLRRYDDIISEVKDSKFEQRAVTVVISGNRAKAEMAAQKVRLAGYDGRLADLNSSAPAHLMPWISDRWSSHFRWRGEGPMHGEEGAKLGSIVKRAHQDGRLVRFWDTPEKADVWLLLRSAGVDLINTDQLQKLQEVLNALKD